MSRIERAKSYFLGYETGEADAVLAAFAENATYWGIEQQPDGRMGRRLRVGKAELRPYVQDWIDATSGGVVYTFQRAEEWGDCVVVEFSDVADGPGGHYENRGLMLFEFNEDDEIVHARPYMASSEAMSEWLPAELFGAAG